MSVLGNNLKLLSYEFSEKSREMRNWMKERETFLFFSIFRFFFSFALSTQLNLQADDFIPSSGEYYFERNTHFTDHIMDFFSTGMNLENEEG